MKTQSRLVSDLTGPALDWATEVSCIMSLNNHSYNHATKYLNNRMKGYYRPRGWSLSWLLVGPIIEREQIAIAYEPSMLYDDSCRWKALCSMSDNEHQYGPTPLIAAMRCYVASKLGEFVEIPEELL